MPSFSIHYGPEHKLDSRTFSGMAESLAGLAKDMLSAKPATIQILPVALAHTPLGSPIYVEIQARDEEHRSGEILTEFLKEVDAVTFETFGVRCRIRYFRFPASFLAAIN